MDLVLICLIGFTGLISFKGFNDTFFFRKYDFHIASIKEGAHYRMFSSAFLHADLTHFFFNMYTLYMFAPVVVHYFGDLSFLLVYFLSLSFGSLLTLQFHKKDNYYRAIGASGAVTGIVYTSILLEPGMSLYLFFIPIPIPACIFGIGYLLYSIYGMKSKNDSIGHTAHFGGAIGGYLFTILKEPQILFENTIMVIALAVPIILFFVLLKLKKI